MFCSASVRPSLCLWCFIWYAFILMGSVLWPWVLICANLCSVCVCMYMCTCVLVRFVFICAIHNSRKANNTGHQRAYDHNQHEQHLCINFALKFHTCWWVISPHNLWPPILWYNRTSLLWGTTIYPTIRCVHLASSMCVHMFYEPYVCTMMLCVFWCLCSMYSPPMGATMILNGNAYGPAFQMMRPSPQYVTIAPMVSNGYILIWFGFPQFCRE